MPYRSDTDDGELLNKAKSGNAEAFGELYELHAPLIFRYLFAHLDNRMDAEDLTGEVFLRTWNALPKYDERGIPFLAFLFRIARNALIDTYRRDKHQDTGFPEELEATLRDPRPEPTEIINTRLEHQELQQLLGELQEDYRTILLLRFFNDMSHEEIAEVMERSVGAVRVLQHRALIALRKLLD